MPIPTPDTAGPEEIPLPPTVALDLETTNLSKRQSRPLGLDPEARVAQASEDLDDPRRAIKSNAQIVRERILSDLELVKLLDQLHEALLGLDFAQSLGAEGWQFALDQTASIAAEAPYMLRREQQDFAIHISYEFVTGVSVLAQQAFSVTDAINDQRRAVVDAWMLAQQLERISQAPSGWIEPLKTLRRGEHVPAILGKFPGLNTEAFNTCLVCVLAGITLE